MWIGEILFEGLLVDLSLSLFLKTAAFSKFDL